MTLETLKNKTQDAWQKRGGVYGPDSIWVALAWYYWLNGDRMPMNEKRKAREDIIFRRADAFA